MIYSGFINHQTSILVHNQSKAHTYKSINPPYFSGQRGAFSRDERDCHAARLPRTDRGCHEDSGIFTHSVLFLSSICEI